MNRLYEIRKALELTLAKFAERIGTTASAVSNWEHGEKIPDVRVYQICKEFNVNRDWLENGVGEMFAKEAPLDDVERMRRMVGDLFEMLPEDKQKILYEAVQDWIKNYGVKKDC